MLSACFSQPLPHFKRFLLRLTGNCFPKQVPLPPAAHSAEGPWLWQRAGLPWPPAGGGPHAGPGQALRRTRGVSYAQAPMGTDQRVSGELQYIPESDLSCRHASRCLAPLTPRIPVHTLHAQCPHNSGYCRPLSSLQFPSALTTAPMRQIALFFNDTETFEHCISRIPSRER